MVVQCEQYQFRAFFQNSQLTEKKRDTTSVVSLFSGGDEEDRTLDLTDANRTLSQLSYAPTYDIHIIIADSPEL